MIRLPSTQAAPTAVALSSTTPIAPGAGGRRIGARAWAGVVAVIVAAGAVGVGLTAGAGEAAAAAKDRRDLRRPPESRGERLPDPVTLAELTAKLDLTPEQTAKLAPVEARVNAARKVLRAEIEARLEDIRNNTVDPRGRDLKKDAKDVKDPKDLKDIKKAAAEMRPVFDPRSEARLAVAPLRELEEEWLDAVATVCTKTQRDTLRQMRTPAVRPATGALPPRPADDPMTKVAAAVRDLELSAEQQDKLNPMVDGLRNRIGEVIRTHTEELELMLTPDQRSASDRVRKARAGDVTPTFLFDVLPQLGLKKDEFEKASALRTKMTNALRDAMVQFRRRAEDHLGEAQIEKLDKRMKADKLI